MEFDLSSHARMLLLAAWGDSRGLRELLNAGSIQDIDWRHDDGPTALMQAAAHGHSAIVDLLLDRGAQVEASMEGNTTALTLAVDWGHHHVISPLIRGGANVLRQDDDGLTAFARACTAANGKIAVVAEFLNTLDAMNAVDVIETMLKATDRKGSTSLIIASLNGHLEIVQLLIDRGVDVLAKNADGDDALIFAVLRGELAVAQYLLANGADANCRNASTFTPLICATVYGELHMMRALIDGGAHVNLMDGGRSSALHFAVREGQCDIIECLLDAQADVDLVDDGGFTPLMSAAFSGREEAVALLIRRNANVHLVSVNGDTPLTGAAARGHAGITRILLDAGSDNGDPSETRYGIHALMAASYFGHEAVVRVLVEHSAQVDVQGYRGNTALVTAAARGHTSVCRFLLKHTANPNLQNMDGRTALHLAVASGKLETARLFIEAGVDTSIIDVYGMTALSTALSSGNFEMVKLLENAPDWEPLEPNSVCLFWPAAALFEFYGRVEPGMPRIDPSWYVDPSMVTESASGDHQVRPASIMTEATWMGSHVTIIRPRMGSLFHLEELGEEKPVTGAMFVMAIQQRITYSHPHVLKLFGACHREQPLLVVEYSSGSLRSYLREHPHRTWRVLHQAALGLQYLHERGTPQGNLHGDIITFGEDGLARLGGVGVFDAVNTSSKSLQCNWLSPDILHGLSGPTTQSDIYAFGMCIIEAVSGELPYAVEIAAGADVESMAKARTLPTRHEAFSDRGWQLVINATATPSETLTIEALVQELEALAAEEEQAVTSSTVPTLDQITHRLESARSLDLDQTDKVQTSLLIQLTALVADLTKAEREPALLRRCFEVIDRFALHLETTSALNEAETHSAGRRRSGIMMSLHTEIERIAREIQPDQATNGVKSRAVWHVTYAQSWREHQLQFEKELEMVCHPRSPNQATRTSVEQLYCTLFEITWQRGWYSEISHEVMQRATNSIVEQVGESLPDWFFPWYEVTLASPKPFSKGGFGEVYQGKWMGSDVVVKKCITFDQHIFVREVTLWFSLHHPNVVKLFGACHVGQQMFVAEWATYGQLDTYLAATKRIGRSVVWEKLHEAALGLRYLHLHDIVHRDLKCNNVLVGRDEKAKITDFGLSSLTQTSEAGGGSEQPKQQAFGNARWAAPEVLRGKKPSYQSDVYSFGLCVVEAVTGRLPYADTRDGDVVAMAVAAGDFLSRPKEFVSDEHWALVTSCCTHDPADRPSMDQLVLTLAQFAEDERRDGNIFISACEPAVVEREETAKAMNDVVSEASQRDTRGAKVVDRRTPSGESVVVEEESIPHLVEYAASGEKRSLLEASVYFSARSS